MSLAIRRVMLSQNTATRCLNPETNRMTLEAKSPQKPLVESGRLNTIVGWLLMLTGLLATAALDPWYFRGTSVPDADQLPHMARHAQGVLLAMTLLQLAVGRLLAVAPFPSATQRGVALLTLAGAIIYAIGYTLALILEQAGWAVLVGSLLNFAGFAICLIVGPTGEHAARIRVVLLAACFGMLLDFVAGLFLIMPIEIPLGIGQYDEVRVRMLRLARVAAIALSVLTLLYVGLTTRDGKQTDWQRFGERMLVGGAIGMPSILAAACFISLYLKYLLPLPATAVFIGVGIATATAKKSASVLELWGWALILASVSVGMLMGMYAFAGPLPTPSMLGDYLELARQRSILAHSYAIVLGIASIFVARRISAENAKQMLTKAGVSLLIAGSVISVAVLVVGIGMAVPAGLHAIGPLASFAGIACVLIVQARRASE